HLYLLIDNSASMAYQEGMSTLLQRALREAANAVDALRQDDPVTLVVGCDETRRRNGRPLALLRKTVDHGKVKEVLSRVPLSHGRFDPAAALAEIAAVAEPGDPHRTLLVLSDFARADWAPTAADGPAASGLDAPLAIRSQIDRLAQQRFELEGAFRFLGDPDPEDFAILDLRPADGRAPAEGMPVAFEVTVANNGPHAASADVRFLVDRKEVASKRVTLRGRPHRSPVPESTRVPFTWTGVAGSHVVEAEASGTGNRLRLNDRRGHAFDVRRRVGVLLVDGDPAPPEGFPETFLLETALSLRRGVLPAEVRVVPATDLARERFELQQVVVLANLDRVSDEAWTRLDAFVRRGGGLLAFLGAKTDPDAWNAAARRFPGLLPARLASRPRVAPDDPLSVALTESSHPALRDLTDPRAGTSFESPLVHGWWPVETPLDEGTQVLLRLRDLEGVPYLLERSHGRGRTMLCTTTADLDWSGPSLLYAPLVQETISWLASAGGEPRDLIVHGTLVCEVPEGARAIAVRGWWSQPGEGEAEQAFPAQEAVRRAGAGPEEPSAVVFSETGHPGAYSVRWEAPDAASVGEGVEERVFAVNLDPREADTGRLVPADLEDRAGRTGLAPRGEADTAALAREREREAERGDLTRPALALGLLCLLGEMFLAAHYGRRRR
ncbi:MAG TPA: hypothetical protein VFS92_07500, partial [Planctomycetota bacterium]|nr:hypothetical protein [Planctomycetota bacterium]